MVRHYQLEPTFQGGTAHKLLTKREFISTHILAALVSRENTSIPYKTGWEQAPETLANIALAYADELLRQCNELTPAHQPHTQSTSRAHQIDITEALSTQDS